MRGKCLWACAQRWGQEAEQPRHLGRPVLQPEAAESLVGPVFFEVSRESAQSLAEGLATLPASSLAPHSGGVPE